MPLPSIVSSSARAQAFAVVQARFQQGLEDIIRRARSDDGSGGSVAGIGWRIHSSASWLACSVCRASFQPVALAHAAKHEAGGLGKGRGSGVVAAQAWGVGPRRLWLRRFPTAAIVASSAPSGAGEPTHRAVGLALPDRALAKRLMSGGFGPGAWG